jgi:hypothetical protein
MMPLSTSTELFLQEKRKRGRRRRIRRMANSVIWEFGNLGI